ncbi:hypothetical protein ACHAXA_007856 [Cyclostephanos tholiformis]|uniref:Peptidase M14 domain-containing protein n=1 Tax=Cyclostephanos tholiformis TaxID=382380 RepID=A0ABD3RBG9_9STRA
MRTKHDYPIGTPGVPWGIDERWTWLASRRKRRDRDYRAAICARMSSSSTSSSSSSFDGDEDHDCHRSDIAGFVPIVYGTLEVKDEDGSNVEEYPLLAYVSENASFLRPRSSSGEEGGGRGMTSGSDGGGICGGGGKKPAVLITGGVHGYETSGIFGAMHFLTSGLAGGRYSRHYDIVVVPCVSPWGYEYNERWTARAIDPNRSFRPSTEDDPNPTRTEESSKLISFLNRLGRTPNIGEDDGEDEYEEDGTMIRNGPDWLCHVDLHETTDTDVTEYRPARAARDGQLDFDDRIPDGFYLFGAVDDDDNDNGGSNNCVREFYDAILSGVEGSGTHLAEVENDGTLCGYKATRRGLLLLSRSACANMGICAGGALPNVPYAVTTEAYPDSCRTSGEDCVNAQVEAICAALDFLIDGGVVPR